MTSPAGALTVRPAHLNDVAAITAIEADLANHGWSESGVRDHLALETTFAWVTVVGAQTTGHLIGSVVADEGELLTLAVLKPFRRQGHARRLLDAAEKTWRTRGATVLFAEVRVDNSSALALYKQRGWQRCGARTGYYSDGTDAVLLTLDLSPCG